MTEDKSILIKTAYAYYQKGDWDRAIEEYHKLADLDSGDLNVLNILADIYAKKGDLQEALRQYDLVAQGYDQKNQVDKVLQVYKRMLKLVPNNQELMGAVKNLVTKYLDRATQMEENDPQRAGEIYKSILRADPNRYDASVRYAKLLMKSGEKYQAVENLMVLSDALDPSTQTGRLAEVLQLVTEWDPLNIEAHERLAALLVGAKQPAEAISHYRALVEIFISKNDHAKAEECAHKAIDLGDIETYYHLGVIHFNQEHYGEARNAFVTFLAKHESHVGALKYLALSHLRLDQNKEAVDTYVRIMQVYVNENLIDEALEVRHTILELDPGNEAALKLVPEAAGAAKTGEAASAAEGAEPVDPGPEQQRLMDEAASFVEKGLYDQAVDRYLEMLKRWPDHAEARNQLQKTYVLMAKAVEPEPKGPNPEEIKAQLERELREQMKREIDEQARKLSEEQARLAAERQAAIDRIRQEEERERLRLQSEMEAKLKEEAERSRREEELRQQLQKELEEKQKALEEQQKKLEAEKQATLERLKAEEEQRRLQREEELRRQHQKELEEKQKAIEAQQATLEAEKRAALERLQAEEEQRRLRQEEELRQQMKKDLEERLQRELAEKQKAIEAQQATLEAEKRAALERLQAEEERRRAQREEELRLQMQRDLEERQKALEAQRQKLEAEKNDVFNQLKADLERSKRELEQKVKEQLEKDLKERAEREARERAEREAREREKQAERDAKVQELMQRELEEKRRFEEEKQKQATVQARVNREIVDGLERLRREKELEASRPASPPPPTKPRVSPSLPTLDLSIETPIEAEIDRSASKATQPSQSTEAENLEDPFVRQTLADIYAKQGLFVEALKIYEKILTDEPDNEEVRNKLRNLLKMKGL